MRIIGIDLPWNSRPECAESTLVLLGDDGSVSQVQRVGTLPEVAAAVAGLAGGDPFLLGVDVPVVVPGKQARARPVENLMRRRFGFRMQAGGRASLTADHFGIAGEALMAGLAAAGQPCLPYPDRDRRRPGMAETYPALILKSLLWSGSRIANSREMTEQRLLFRSYSPPPYRAAKLPAKTNWAGQAVAIDFVLRALGNVEGFDLEPLFLALATAADEVAVERVAARLDATLIAGMARRYLEAPESCLFVGDRESGYVILPADAFIRRLASDTPPQIGRLFPRASLRERLGNKARTRSGDLLSVPGRPQKVVANFSENPSYEFDNLDEMLWWKHTRHLAGPVLPTDGLHELVVTLGSATPGAEPLPTLKLCRSRHATLSFRFDPPSAWRHHVATRDGRTYSFQVLTAVYETLPSEE